MLLIPGQAIATYMHISLARRPTYGNQVSKRLGHKPIQLNRGQGGSLDLRHWRCFRWQQMNPQTDCRDGRVHECLQTCNEIHGRAGTGCVLVSILAIIYCLQCTSLRPVCRKIFPLFHLYISCSFSFDPHHVV